MNVDTVAIKFNIVHLLIYFYLLIENSSFKYDVIYIIFQSYYVSNQ